MGKNKKGFNWKARQNTSVTVASGPAIPLQLDRGIAENAPDATTGNDAVHDDSNAIVLPSQKRKTKKAEVCAPKQKFLSHRQKKMQERLKEKRTKSAKRGELIKAIQAVQASELETKEFVSITQMQTKGLKRHRLEKLRASSGKKKVKSLANEEDDSAVERNSVVQETSESSDDESQPESSDTERRQSRDIDVDPVPPLIVSEFPDAQPTSNITENLGTRDRDSSPEAETVLPKANPFRRLHNIPVSRLPEIQDQRSRLPVTGEEQSIMEAINTNDVVVICGETGSGKTTQVPQFLYEAGYASGDGIIGVTEPRRVAAISMSQRVGTELNRPDEVSYQIRYEGNWSQSTKIKFMTDGVLMREVANDFLLQKYSVIVVDEAHERSVFTDILIGLLSRIVPLRRKKGIPLKFVIMSATLRIEDFTENKLLFPFPPPVMKITTRQHPVTIHFNRRTPSEKEYLQDTFKKICKIHQTLPAGGILVFVTGQQEVHALCKRLRETFPRNDKSKLGKSRAATDIVVSETNKEKQPDESVVSPSPDVNTFKLDAYPVHALDEEEGQAVTEADEDVDEDDAEMLRHSDEPMTVLPLYSLLPSERQALVFQPVPQGTRLCVVATNVAETSITIPDVKYVVDTGKTKMKLYDKNTGLCTFRVVWTSKASANQRAGRAGRTSAGHCYRIYSSAVFNDDFPQHTPPEITRRPVEDLVLQMKAMNIEKIANFPFPTPPSVSAIAAAEKELLSLGAIERVVHPKHSETADTVTSITSLGKTMSLFPVAPRFAKALSLCGDHNLMPYMITLISALSVQEPILEGKLGTDDSAPENDPQRRSFLNQLKKRWIGSGFSKKLGDLMVLLKAVGAAEFAGLTFDYCNQHFLRFKAMKEIRQLRQQLTNAVNLVLPKINCLMDPLLPPPSELQCKMMLQVLLCCMQHNIARKISPAEVAAAEPKEKAKLRNAYRTSMLEELVYIHPFSVVGQESPEFVLYQELFEGNRIYCRNVAEIDPIWIPKFAPVECVFSPPLDTPEPRFDKKTGRVVCHRTSTFGPHAWILPSVEVDYPAGLDLYRWFGKFFLEGAVLESLKPLSVHLLVKPGIMVKSWSSLQPKTQTFLRALADRNIDCREKLLAIWRREPQYLMYEYLQWLPTAYHAQAQSIWPPG